jgi:hypothetical protein
MSVSTHMGVRMAVCCVIQIATLWASLALSQLGPGSATRFGVARSASSTGGTSASDSAAWSIAGTVISTTGDPVAGAKVVLHEPKAGGSGASSHSTVGSSRGSLVVASTTTDELGKFSVNVSTRSRLAVRVECAGYYAYPWRDTYECVIESEPRLMTIALVRRLPVTVKVTGHDGLPLKDCHIEVSEAPTLASDGSKTFRQPAKVPAAITSDDGTAQVPAEPGLHVLRITARGHAPRVVRANVLDYRKRIQEIRLNKGGAVRGTLDLSSCASSARPQVRCRDEQTSSRPHAEQAQRDLVIIAARREELTGDLTLCFMERAIAGEVHPDGSFRFDGLAAGFYAINVYVSDDCTAEIDSIYVVEGEETDIGSILPSQR